MYVAVVPTVYVVATGRLFVVKVPSVISGTGPQSKNSAKTFVTDNKAIDN